MAQVSDAELQQAFQLFDKSGDGKINASELQGALAQFGQTFSEAEIQKVIAAFDGDKEGTLNFAEFKKLVEFGLSQK